VRAISHDVSSSVRPHEVLLARLMDGPPASALWGPVGFLTRESGRGLRQLLEPYMDAVSRCDAAGGLAAAMQAASREITIMLAPVLGPANAGPKTA
jgi:hypothetical protein